MPLRLLAADRESYASELIGSAKLSAFAEALCPSAAEWMGQKSLRVGRPLICQINFEDDESRGSDRPRYLSVRDR
jgi:hypothetical protein